MAKAKKSKKNHHKKNPIMGRSDIPYAQRIHLQQRNDIIASRDHAAKITMFCMSVAMNEVEGIGYKRLVKFSLHFKEIVDEFYEDIDLGMAHAKRRMDQMGMPISGEFYAIDVPGLSKRDQQIHDHVLQAVQIAQICGAIAMNDVFGFAKERQTRISERVNELTARYKDEGEQFLLEKLGKIGFLIVGGEARAFMADDEEIITPARARKEGFPDAQTEADQR